MLEVTNLHLNVVALTVKSLARQLSSCATTFYFVIAGKTCNL
jgi:hypothetical protein